jgi:sulfate adenylyltransferase
MTEHQPLNVLFVCTANICRSPYMELLARHLAPPGTGLRFSSAGTMGMREEPMDPTMAAQLVLRGASAEGFRSRRATGALVEQADVVLTAESSHRALLLEEHPGAFRRIFPLAQFAELAEGLPEETGRDLVAAAARSGGPATPAHDIVDPYGRGSEAAAASADRLDQLVSTVVRRLREVDVRQ